MATKTGKEEEVRAGDLQVDMRYQRRLEPARVNRIASDFNWQAFHRPAVARYRDGRLFIVDGGHRVAAAIKAFGDDNRLPVIVYEALKQRDLADLYLKFNEDRRRPGVSNRFNSMVLKGDEMMVNLDDILVRHGFNARHPNVERPECVKFPAVEAAITVARRPGGLQVVDDTLTVLEQGWPTYGATKRMSNGLFRGVAEFIRHMREGTHPEVPLTTLSEFLSIYEPAQLARIGRGYGGGYGAATGLRQYIAEEVNKNDWRRVLSKATNGNGH